jgi:hypothetical protein
MPILPTSVLPKRISSPPLRSTKCIKNLLALRLLAARGLHDWTFPFNRCKWALGEGKDIGRDLPRKLVQFTRRVRPAGAPRGRLCKLAE